MSGAGLATWLAALVLAPLLSGVIGRTKARMAGRRGAPILQPYRDLARLLGKGAVYSRTTTWLFRLGPVAGLAGVAVALLFVPAAGQTAAVAFPGDVIAVAYALGLARFATALAALDTGSSFEGMGASRELFFSALAELALFGVVLVLALGTRHASLSGLLGPDLRAVWAANAAAPALAAAALLVVLLSENARLPVDDPATHLELTMIHEVMILDHGGPDLALLEYAAALKLWLYAALLGDLLLPFRTGSSQGDMALFGAGLLGLGVAVGILESVTARLRLARVPQLLVGAAVLAAFAVVLSLR